MIRSRYILTFIFLTLSLNTNSAVFCVSTANELQSALSTAGSNSQSDVIKLVEGEYIGRQLLIQALYMMDSMRNLT